MELGLIHKLGLAGACCWLLVNTAGYAELDRSKLVPVNAENRQRCVEYFLIDGKDYCSTQALLSPQAHIPALTHEKFKVFFDHREWEPGWGKHDASGTTLEYVPKGQKVEAWQELITTQFQPGQVPAGAPLRYAKWVEQTLTQKGYKPVFVIHEQSPTEVIFEFKVKEPKAEAQNELQRVFIGKGGLYFIHYAIRQPDMPAHNRTQWLQNLKKAFIQ